MRGFRGARTRLADERIVGTMEEQIRKIVREEIARAFQAVENVADAVYERVPTGSAEHYAADTLRRAMQRVAADVLADTHPVLDAEHTRVHTVTSVPARSARASMVPPNRDMIIPKRGEVVEAEHAPDDACTCGHDRYRHRSGTCFACDCQAFTPVRGVPVASEEPKAACTCHRHTHVMGQEDFCGVLGCFCRTPVRRPHFNPGCGHGPCDGWAQCRSTDRPADEPVRAGTHAGHTILGGRCVTCTETETRAACSVCEHAPHWGTCPYAVPGGACTCNGVRA